LFSVNQSLQEESMDAGAWAGLLVTAAVLLTAIAALVPRIREHRAEQAHAREIDELHRARERDFVHFRHTDVQESDAEPINSPTPDDQRRLARWN
jgi:hypothetical protein